MPEAQVLVRMYRHGLGDCLLLSFPRDGAEPFRMMIDCGVIQGTEDGTARMQAVVKDIIAETKGYIDVLVLTHEHWDHVSGFSQAQELFVAGGEAEDGKLAVGQVWVAWTENEADGLARRLRDDRENSLRALQGISDHMQTQGLGAANLRLGLSEVLGFFGAARGGTTAAMDFAKDLGGAKRRYWLPSDPPWEDAALPGIRIYALGPPHDEKMIKRTFVRKEVYHEFANNALAESLFAAATLHFDGDLVESDIAEVFYPFDRGYGHAAEPWMAAARPVPEAAAKAAAGPAEESRLKKREHRFFNESYAAATDSWRRIDGDWLNGAADLALRLDSATNNTSLVLAVELIETGKVLLFAADAQVGNWLSWQDLKWRLADGTEVTGPDLLARTVFYKVGHHGSHNATLKEKGLEAMSDEEFVAFLPVDVDAARKKRWNQMPLPALVEALRKRAQGRVVQLDSGVKYVYKAVREDFLDRFEETKKYFEYRVD